jgi:uncharacterized membrane protein YdjX (TVP38/TMEM64 family)
LVLEFLVVVEQKHLMFLLFQHRIHFYLSMMKLLVLVLFVFLMPSCVLMMMSVMILDY